VMGGRCPSIFFIIFWYFSIKKFAQSLLMSVINDAECFVMKAADAEPAAAAALKTDAADVGDVKDAKIESDKKHKQRRWSETPDANNMSKVYCV